MKRQINIWRQCDKITIFLFLVLVIMGWFNIYAAVYSEEQRGMFNFSQLYGKQFIWIVSSVILAVVVMTIDNRFYLFFAWVVYGIIILCLLAVLVLGKEVNGATSWFELGFVRFQPSEFAKFATALALASYFHSHKVDLTSLKGLVTTVAIIMLPACLILLQPDMGSTIVFFSFFFVLFREGMSPIVFVAGVLMVFLFFMTLLVNNIYLDLAITGVGLVLFIIIMKKVKPYLVGVAVLSVSFGLLFAIDYFFIKKSMGINTILIISMLLTGALVGYYAFQKKAKDVLIVYLFVIGSIIYINFVDFGFNKLKPHQQTRIELLLGLKSDPQGSGYNLNQSLISIGSGGLIGKGYLNGTQTKFKFVPAQSTDFIFCTVGEEWGFVGSTVLIILYVILLLRLLYLSERQRSVFARVYGYGVVSILFVHFLINIGMTIGLVPVIGIPLPFFSYGGSSLWGFTILMFIFLKLDATRTEYLV